MPIETLPKMKIAYMRQVGPYGPPLMDLWKRFNKWVDRRRLLNDKTIRLGLSLDNPMTTPPEQLRYDAAIVVDDKFQVDLTLDPDIETKTLEGGEYLMTPIEGTGKEIGQAFEKLFSEAVPKSGRSFDYRRDVLERYVGKTIGGSMAGSFRCDLGIPVK
jgi:DNA gyrase inhibitor GyrI